MGVNTQGCLDPQVKVMDIVKVLEDKFGVKTTIHSTHDKNYRIVVFKYNDEDRRMSVFENYTDEPHTGFKKSTLIDLNLWGSSIELIRGVVEEFGGYVVDNDCHDQWEYVNKIS